MHDTTALKPASVVDPKLYVGKNTSPCHTVLYKHFPTIHSLLSDQNIRQTLELTEATTALPLSILDESRRPPFSSADTYGRPKIVRAAGLNKVGLRPRTICEGIRSRAKISTS
jgi:hypothetical protein